MHLKTNNFKKNKISVSTILLVLFFCFFIITLIWISLYYRTVKKYELQFDDLKDEIIKDVTNTNENVDTRLNYYVVDGQIVQEQYKNLYMKNNDFIGWISIEDTPIDYPVMQSLYDSDFYLNKDFYKNYSSAGSLFVNIASDIRESDNILIYGHHTNTDTMFSSLLEYENEQYYLEHKYINFNTLYKNSTYEIIAVFRSKIYTSEYEGFEYYEFINASNKETFDEFINNITDLSVIQTEASAKYGDNLLTLSTCAYHTTNGRFVVVAKEIDSVEINESSELIQEIVTKD